MCVYIYTHVYVKLQFGGRSQTSYLGSKLALHFSPQHRAWSLRSTIVLGNHVFDQLGDIPMQQGPLLLDARHQTRLWPHQGCSYSANLAENTAETVHWAAGTSFPVPSTVSLPGTRTFLGWVPWWLHEKAVQSLVEHKNFCTLYVWCAGWTKANPKSRCCVWSSDNSLTHGKGPATRPAQFSLFNLLSTFSGLTAWVAEPPSAI